MTTALLLVDLQNDFMPGGALAVAEGDATVPVANRLIPDYEIVVATQDWHPVDHGSFASQHGKQPGEMIELHGLPQVMWPDHCVANSPGADFHRELWCDQITRVFRKGCDPRVDSYSGFWDNGKRHDTGLATWLRERDVDQVDICGLATDYCVKFTALDAASEGFTTRLLLPACRAVNLQADDGERAVAAMQDAGITIINSV